MLQKIILISGYAQSGKTTTSQLLQKKLEEKGFRVCIIPFAKYLKQILKDHWQWDGVTKSEEIRSQLQVLGTDIIRQKMNKPQFHTSRVCDEIEIVSDKYEYILIDDWRFKSEAYYVLSQFPGQVITVRVMRLNFESPLTDIQKNHITEVDLNDFTFEYWLASESGLDKLDAEVDRFLKMFIYRK